MRCPPSAWGPAGRCTALLVTFAVAAQVQLFGAAASEAVQQAATLAADSPPSVLDAKQAADELGACQGDVCNAAQSGKQRPADPAAQASGRRPKTCVYAIALNERVHVEPFMNASRGADLVLVADTGSTDGTPEALRAAGATVHAITIQPFRFDSARKVALSLLPADCDLCLSLDLDERLQPGWVDALQAVWASVGGLMTAVHATYVDSWERDGVTPAVEFLQTKVHTRGNYTWRGPAYELLYWTGAVGGEHQVMLPTLKVHHRPDASKGRTSPYLDLLKLGVEEDPTDAQRAFHYGRELMHAQQHVAAIKELQRYLSLPGATWREERATAMRHIAHCHEVLQQHDESQAAAHRSVLEWGQSREPWLALAHASRLLDDWPTCQWAATKALGIKERVPSPLGASSSWGAGPHDELALALHFQGRHQQAVEEGETALVLDPGNGRLQANLGVYRAAMHAVATANAGQLQTLADAPDRCKRVHEHLTARELDLQQQRRRALESARGQPEGGYLAICLAVKNQHRDLPEWLDWHSRLGVSKFYIMDNGSDPPLDDVLAPYVADGRVEHRWMVDVPTVAQAVQNATCLSAPLTMQMLSYFTCLHDYGARHQWMAFIDADEFLVPMDNTPDLPTLLRDYERYGGLAVNWRMFGSNGHKQRQNDTLTAYTACFPAENRHCGAAGNLWVKTIANMAFMTRPGSCHTAHYAPGYYAVTPSGEFMKITPNTQYGRCTEQPDYSRLAVNHYMTKSWEDFLDKQTRGNNDNQARSVDFWNYVEGASSQQCTVAADMARRFRAVESP